jgi:hypothetical protein
MFQGAYKDASVNVAKVSSFAPQTTWYNPGVQNFSQPYADLFLLRAWSQNKELQATSLSLRCGRSQVQ